MGQFIVQVEKPRGSNQMVQKKTGVGADWTVVRGLSFSLLDAGAPLRSDRDPRLGDASGTAGRPVC